MLCWIFTNTFYRWWKLVGRIMDEWLPFDVRGNWLPFYSSVVDTYYYFGSVFWLRLDGYPAIPWHGIPRFAPFHLLSPLRIENFVLFSLFYNCWFLFSSYRCPSQFIFIISLWAGWTLKLRLTIFPCCLIVPPIAGYLLRLPPHFY